MHDETHMGATDSGMVGGGRVAGRLFGISPGIVPTGSVWQPAPRVTSKAPGSSHRSSFTG